MTTQASEPPTYDLEAYWLKAPKQAGGADQQWQYRAAIDLTPDDVRIRPYRQPRRVEVDWAWLVGLVCLVVPWLVGIGVLASAGLRLIGGE